ncbi:MAG TPA: hypothetical protein VGN12_11085 [Pirellulales bacterium]
MRVLRCVLFAAWTTVVAAPIFAQLPAAQLHALSPAGGRQGTIVDVKLAAGVDIEGADRLVFSHPHITAVQKSRPAGLFEKGQQPIPNEFTVAIHPDVPPGVYEARFAGRFGVSNPRAFVVGSLPEQSEPADNHTVDKAAAIPLNTIINGTADATANDFFKIALKKDEQVIIDVWAERIDSRMDATLAIYDATGRELATDRDTNRRDPLLAFTAPADGEYVIKLFDFLYRGGNDHFYRLLVSTGPYVDFVFPPVAVPGTKASFTLYGSHLPGGEKVAGLTSRGRPLEKLTVEIEAPTGSATEELAISSLARAQDVNLDGFEYRLTTPTGSSNPLLIGFTSAAVVAEQEPNNDPDKPQAVTAPCTYVGQFTPRGDYDWISFDAKKGEAYWIEAISQRLGLPTDPYLLIQRVTRNDKGEVQATDVQELDDTAKGIGIATFKPDSDDPAYRFTAPEDGTYRILIRDLYAGSRGDPRLVYALAIRKAAPDYRLVAVPAYHANLTAPAESQPGNPLLRRGGTEMINVVALRRDGFDGEIPLAVEGLPAGVTVSKSLIPAGQNTTTLVLRASDEQAAWTGAIHVVGKAQIEGKEVPRVARPASTQWSVAATQSPDSRVARDLWLSVIDRDTAPVLVELGEDKTWEMSRAGKLEIPVKVTRRGDMKQPVTLTAIALPANVKAAPITIAPEASDGKLVLEIADKARPGLYDLRLQVGASVPYRRDPQSAEAAATMQKEIDRLAGEITAASQAAEQARQAAEKSATDSAAAAKQTIELAQAESQKLVAATDAMKAAQAKLAQAREAADKDSTNQDLVQAKDTAEKAAGEAQTQLQAVTATNDAAQKAAAEATAKSQAAAAEKSARDKAAADAAAKAKSAADAKTAADKRAADLAKAAEPKNVNIFETSTSTQVKITDGPLSLAVTPLAAAVKPGTTTEVPVTLGRLYAFAEPIEVELIVPETAKGLSAAKLAIPGDQAASKFALVAAADAAPGKHALTARTKFKFGGADFQVDAPLAVEIETAK